MFNEETVTRARNNNDSSWKVKLRNAIIVKCSMNAPPSGHGICHIFVDERSAHEGLVYIKCRDVAAASLAYEALHGWWCEKMLVVVRFLKPDRYYSRFPDAKRMTTPLTVDPSEDCS